MFSMIESGQPDIGFIADDVKRLYPEAVGSMVKDGGLLDGKKIKQLSQSKLTAVVSYQVNRAEDNIEKLEKQNAKLTKDNTKLKSEVKSMSARLARLEKQVVKLAA
jgi:predicted RNase H-like nuclease (RuvC/YqgF family)